MSAREQESRTERAGEGLTIGVDFGTESGRVLLLDTASGSELAVKVVRYPHGVIEHTLPDGERALPSDWALQDPADWVGVLDIGIPAVLEQAGVDGSEVVGIGVDFTSCTVLPVDAEGVPLCMAEQWRAHPHAWPKLWKHHAAQHVADRLNETALARGDEFLTRYGGRISSEWYFPKLIELWLEDRAVYDTTAAFLEATDWIIWHLTGHECRQSCTAGYKALWSADGGLPPTAFFADAYPGLHCAEREAGRAVRGSRDARGQHPRTAGRTLRAGA